jgi:hypothetical protein
MLLIRDRRDPRNKGRNDRGIPLFAATGFDAGQSVPSASPGAQKAPIAAPCTC